MLVQLMANIEDESSDSNSSTNIEDMIGPILLIRECMKIFTNRADKQPCRTSELLGRQYMIELLNGHEDRLFESCRMDKSMFHALCHTLRTMDFLQDTKIITVEEALGMFLLTVCHNTRNRIIAERFQHSKETISCQFSRVLKAINRLAPHIILPRATEDTPPEILTNPKYYPWFKVKYSIHL